MLLLALPLALAAPSDADLVAAVASFQAHAIIPLPEIDADRWAQVLDGKVAHFLQRGSKADAWQAVGLYLSSEPMDRLWLACQDPHFSLVDRVTEKRLSKDPHSGGALWYGLYDLPIPFDDRQWVVEVRNNGPLALATRNRIWEHIWRIDGTAQARIPELAAKGALNGVSPEQVEKALWIPVSNGGWVMFALDADHTLVAYHTAAELGGFIPDRLVAEASLRGMDKLIKGVEARAREEVRPHYSAGHEEVMGGDNLAIPTW